MKPTGRIAGIQLPLFSLRARGDFGIGDFGALDGLFAWMERAKQRMLMLLPLLPTAPGDASPYSTKCAFGLNPLFIDLSRVPGVPELSPAEAAQLQQARSAKNVRYDLVFGLKGALLERTFLAFEAQPPARRDPDFERFCSAESAWLNDFALFTALSEEQRRAPWWEWPQSLAGRQPAALAEAKSRLAPRVRFQQWLQWVAHQQWQTVRAQAKSRGVLLCGDEPFIVSQDSCDVWCNPHLLRRDGRLGVPPDPFSADGQDWGLPWFDFQALEKENDAWLKLRARYAAGLYDMRRVDHAIGYFRQYVRDEQTPRGRFVPEQESAWPVLGEKNFRLLSEGASIIAEDLGVIPPWARETLQRLQLPGYCVTRWEREHGVYRNPREYPEISLATTGTHDTETLRGWWQSCEHWEREALCRAVPECQRFDPPGPAFTRDVHEALVASALNSNSRLCLIPWQDVFAEEERVNQPGTMGTHNWCYRIAHDVESLLSNEETVAAAAWLARLTEAGRRVS